MIKPYKEHSVDKYGRPLGRLNMIQYKNCTWKIMPMMTLSERIIKADDFIPYDRIISTPYAVFYRTSEMHFWQQCTPWFEYYGNALRTMVKLSKTY